MFNALIFTNSSVTGGVGGLPIDRVSFAGIDLDPLGHPQRYGAFVLVVLVLVGLLVANLRRGRVGARLLAVRSNERAAASLGINVIAAKVYAFAVAAAIAALGGVLLSMRQTNVEFTQYNVFGSVLLIQYAVVGGIAWVSGAAVAATGAPTGARQRHLREDRAVGHRHRVVARGAVGPRRDLGAAAGARRHRGAAGRAGSAGRGSVGSLACTGSSRGCAFPRPVADAPVGAPTRGPAGRDARRHRSRREVRRCRRGRRRELRESNRARSSGSSARTARARRRSSTSSPASPRRRADRSCSAEPRSTTGRSNGGPAPASSPDTPTLQFAGQLIVKIALLKVKVDRSTTRRTRPTSRRSRRRSPQNNDEAVGMLPLNPVVVVNALAQEGITPDNHDMVVPGGVITPESLKELGDAANGILVVSEAMPPTETSNKGIAEFRADMEADGKDPDDPNVDAGTVTSWSNVKKLEGALLAAGPEGDRVARLEECRRRGGEPSRRPARGRAVRLPQARRSPRFPDLAGFRVFTRKVAVLQIEDGKYKVLSDGFIDILKPPDLPTNGGSRDQSFNKAFALFTSACRAARGSRRSGSFGVNVHVRLAAAQR